MSLPLLSGPQGINIIELQEISNSVLRTLNGNRSETDIELAVQTLRKAVSFFYRVDPTVLAEVARRMRYRLLQPGEFLFQQGDPSDHLYVLLDGRVDGV